MENILLLHGALGSQQQFLKLQQELQKLGGYNVFSMNFEGHGGRGSERSFRMDYFVENVINFMSEKHISKTSIFGYSMGGYVALNLCLNRPELVNRIITFGTKFNWTVESASKEVKMLDPDVIEEKVPKFAQHLRELHAPNDWKELLNKTADMMLDLGAGNKLNSDLLNKINHEVLITVGSEDKMVTIQETEQAADELVNAQYKVLEGLRHELERNSPVEFCRVIEAFI